MGKKLDNLKRIIFSNHYGKSFVLGRWLEEKPVKKEADVFFFEESGKLTQDQIDQIMKTQKEEQYMGNFKKYKRTNIAEMREVTQHEVDNPDAILDNGISVSQADLENGSPKIGDMIARNPDNHADKWLVAKDYYEKNFAPIGGTMKTEAEIWDILDLFNKLPSEKVEELGSDHSLALSTLLWVLEGGEFPTTLPGEEEL